MLTVQPTPLPWSARQSHMWSPMTLSLLTSRLVVALPTPAPPMRKNTSCSEVGLAAWLADGAGRADLHQDRRVDRAGVEQEAGDLDAVDVGDRHRGDAVVGDQRGQAEAEDDGVGPGHLDGLVEVVDARA